MQHPGFVPDQSASRAVMWTVRRASWQLTKATLTGRTFEMPLVMLIMVSLWGDRLDRSGRSTGMTCW